MRSKKGLKQLAPQVLILLTCIQSGGSLPIKLPLKLATLAAPIGTQTAPHQLSWAPEVGDPARSWRARGVQAAQEADVGLYGSEQDSEIEIGNEFYIYTPKVEELAAASAPSSPFPWNWSRPREPEQVSGPNGAPIMGLNAAGANQSERLERKQAGGQPEMAAQGKSGGRLSEQPPPLKFGAQKGQPGSEHKPSLRQHPFCIGHKDLESTFNWLCQGYQLNRVPVDLSPKPICLRLSNTGIETLTRNSLPNYKETLRDFSLENAPKLLAIEASTFAELARLRVIYIFQAPKLVSFDLTGSHPDLTIVRIQQTGLRRWPDFSLFRQERILTSVDLDNNKIATFGSKPINIRTELLNLEFNQISSIEEFTFNGSEIGVLSLSGNRQLKFIHPNAFANLKNLIKLDLSATSVIQLPSVGLHQLRTLIIRDTYTLKRIPSIYVFPMLEVAHLTYAYHCCSFRYPQTHDPSAYEEHLRLQEEINALCANRRDQDSATNGKRVASSDEPTEKPLHHLQQQPPSNPQNSDFEGYFEEPSASMQTNNGTNVKSQPSGNDTSFDQHSSSIPSAESGDRPLESKIAYEGNKSSGETKPNLKKLWLLHNIECGELAIKNSAYQNISCTPEPDAFNPCEDIMGYPVLRVAVWFVVAASVFGNLSVILVLMGVFRRLSVPKFLQLNLAIGDLFMGVYLAMLAFADLTTVGTYFNYAIDWQHGPGCKIAGAASLFASQLSIFTLSVITFERYYTITYSIDLNMRLQLCWAARIMIFGWLFAFASAMMPIFANVNSYSKTSICLPMRTSYTSDWLFILILLIIDSCAFVIIFACYLKMYLLIIRQKTEATAKERTVAMRMALLVFTDFACWAPIIFFGTTALFGQPLISVTNSKILIVFFYPLNSMANPFLYVISTRQYKRDLDYLAARYQLWRKNLFRGPSGSFNSNNVYAIGQHQGSLNVHLGAVAALTSAAGHLRRTNLADGCASTDNQRQAINLHEQRVVCTKSHQGRYIIRHQILGDQRTLCSTTKFRTHLSLKQTDPELPTQKPNENEPDPAKEKYGTVNLSETCSSDQYNELVLAEPIIALNRPDGDALLENQSGVGGSASLKRITGCSKVASPQKRKCGDNFLADCCNKCCKCCSTLGCSQEPLDSKGDVRIKPVSPKESLVLRKTLASDLKSVTLVTALQVSNVKEAERSKSAGCRCSCIAVDDVFRDSVRGIRQPGSPNCVPHSIEASVGGVDILGNISFTEPTSSHSPVSSPQSSQPDNVLAQVGAQEHGNAAPLRLCHHHREHHCREGQVKNHRHVQCRSSQGCSCEDSQQNPNLTSSAHLGALSYSNRHVCHHKHRHHRAHRHFHEHSHERNGRASSNGDTSRKSSSQAAEVCSAEKCLPEGEAQVEIGNGLNPETGDKLREVPSKQKALESILKPANEKTRNLGRRPLARGHSFQHNTPPGSKNNEYSQSSCKERGKKRVSILEHYSG